MYNNIKYKKILLKIKKYLYHLELTIFPSTHSPSLSNPLLNTLNNYDKLLLNLPIPDYLLFFHSPIYFLPSGNDKVPFPCYISSLNSPSYTLPSGH